MYSDSTLSFRARGDLYTTFLLDEKGSKIGLISYAYKYHIALADTIDEEGRGIKM